MTPTNTQGSEQELRIIKQLDDMFPDEELIVTEWDTHWPRILALIKSDREAAFKHGQRVGQYQAADKLYSYVTSIYLFSGDENPKLKDHAAHNAGEMLKDCEKYMNHNRREYTAYLAQLSKENNHD